MLYKWFPVIGNSALAFKKISAHINSANSPQGSVLCSVLSHTQGLPRWRHTEGCRSSASERDAFPMDPRTHGRFPKGPSGEQRDKKTHTSPLWHSAGSREFLSVPQQIHRLYHWVISITGCPNIDMQGRGLRSDRNCYEHPFFSKRD